MPLSLRLYRLLLKFYPAGFREEFAGPLEREFRDEYGEVSAPSGLVHLWARTLIDLAISVPPQFAREIRQDARHAFRLWARRPVQTAFAIVALAIGIGANMGVFSVVNALLLRSLPFREPDRLARLWMFGAPEDFHQWRKESTYLEDAVRFSSAEVNLAGAHESSRIRLAETTWNFFSLLGTRPVIGRTFAPGEDSGNNAVAVIGYGLWQQLFGGAPNALGAKIYANGTPLIVVGVAPPGFDYPQNTVLWTPTGLDRGRIPKTGVIFIEFIGRLKPGLPWGRARQQYEAEAYRRAPHQRHADPPNRPELVPLQADLAGPIRQASLVLMGGVALILLIACANLANLLLARTTERSGELLIRSALGASRARLVQQLLTESVLLSVIGSGAGLVVAHWTASVISAFQPARLAAQAYTVLDWRVLAFSVALSIGTGLGFGVLPALHAARVRSGAVFVRSSAANPGAARLRTALVAGQVSLTVVLLAGSAAVGRAYFTLMRADHGYSTRNVATLSVSLAGSMYEKDDRAVTYFGEVLRRVREVPGVVSASGTEFLPLGANGFMGGQFTVDGKGAMAFAVLIPVMPGYFRTMGGRVLYGREFAQADARSAEPLAVVSEAFSRQFSNPPEVVGTYLRPRSDKPRRIIGVVRANDLSPRPSGDDPQVFDFQPHPSS